MRRGLRLEGRLLTKMPKTSLMITGMRRAMRGRVKVVLKWLERVRRAQDEEQIGQENQEVGRDEGDEADGTGDDAGHDARDAD